MHLVILVTDHVVPGAIAAPGTTLVLHYVTQRLIGESYSPKPPHSDAAWPAPSVLKPPARTRSENLALNWHSQISSTVICSRSSACCMLATPTFLLRSTSQSIGISLEGEAETSRNAVTA